MHDHFLTMSELVCVSSPYIVSVCGGAHSGQIKQFLKDFSIARMLALLGVLTLFFHCFTCYPILVLLLFFRLNIEIVCRPLHCESTVVRVSLAFIAEIATPTYGG